MRLATLRRLSPRRLLLLAEATALVLLAAPAVRRVPLRRLGRWASRPVTGQPPAAPERLVRDVAWAVRAAARRSPLRALCFEQGLAAQLMLRRRGVPSTLFFGAAPGAARPLEAHVWVRYGALDVVGAELAGDFAELARFPAA